MTKREMTTLKDFYNEIIDIGKRKDSIFDELQNMSRDMDLPIYCSAYDNRNQLLKTKYSSAAIRLYDEYMELYGKEELLRQFRYILYELNGNK